MYHAVSQFLGSHSSTWFCLYSGSPRSLYSMETDNTPQRGSWDRPWPWIAPVAIFSPDEIHCSRWKHGEILCLVRHPTWLVFFIQVSVRFEPPSSCVWCLGFLASNTGKFKAQFSLVLPWHEIALFDAATKIMAPITQFSSTPGCFQPHSVVITFVFELQAFRKFGGGGLLGGYSEIKHFVGSDVALPPFDIICESVKFVFPSLWADNTKYSSQDWWFGFIL